MRQDPIDRHVMRMQSSAQVEETVFRDSGHLCQGTMVVQTIQAIRVAGRREIQNKELNVPDIYFAIRILRRVRIHIIGGIVRAPCCSRSLYIIRRYRARDIVDGTQRPIMTQFGVAPSPEHADKKQT